MPTEGGCREQGEGRGFPTQLERSLLSSVPLRMVLSGLMNSPFPMRKGGDLPQCPHPQKDTELSLSTTSHSL